MTGMSGVLTKASIAALAVLVPAAAASAQYGPPEPIGQGGAPVATPHYSPRDPNSPTHVGPVATSPYNRVIVKPRGNSQLQRKR
jgi:hypothetical protein